MKHLKDQTRQRAAEAGYNGPRCLSHDPVHCGRAWTTAHNCRLVNIGMLVGAVVIGTAGWVTFDSWHAAWAAIGVHFPSQAVFRAWIGGFGLWAPAVYFLAVAAQVIVAPIPGNVFPTVGAAAFGPAAALVLTMGGMLVGSAVVFALARRLGRPLVERLVGREPLDKYGHIVSARGGLWLILIYLLPLLPDDAVCAVAGLSAISFRRFLLLSLLGRFPATLFSVYATAELLAQPAWVWLVAVLVLSAGLAVAIRGRGIMESWLARQSYLCRGGEDTRMEEGGGEDTRMEEGGGA